MCVDEIIAQCFSGTKPQEGLCTYGNIQNRRVFRYTLNMNTLDIPAASKYEKLKSRKRRSSPPYFPSSHPHFINRTWNRDDSPGITSQINFIKTFHFFKNTYPGLRKIRVQIVESTLESEKEIDYNVDPLSRWLGIPLTTKQKTNITRPNSNSVAINFKFWQDSNIFWELSSTNTPVLEPELPSFQYSPIDQPISIPLIPKTPPEYLTFPPFNDLTQSKIEIGFKPIQPVPTSHRSG